MIISLKTSYILQICVQAISQTECINSLKKCMENNKELQAITCETLSRLFKSQHVSVYKFFYLPSIRSF